MSWQRSFIVEVGGALKDFMLSNMRNMHDVRVRDAKTQKREANKMNNSIRLCLYNLVCGKSPSGRKGSLL